MKIVGDYHTHSKYSKFRHGKNTIAEMVESAKTKGLKFLAITDHGPKHIPFGIRPKNIDKARCEIDEINNSQNGIKVYLGIEANLISKSGGIDLKQEQIDKLDILLVGFHRLALSDFVSLFNLRSDKPALVEKQTQAYINLVHRYDVDIITHPCEYILVDCKRLAEACAETDTLIELNNRHFRFTPEQMRDMLQTNCKFIISSDSHSKDNIANVSLALEMAKIYNIPEERIVNLRDDYLPKRLRGKNGRDNAQV